MTVICNACCLRVVEGQYSTQAKKECMPMDGMWHAVKVTYWVWWYAKVTMGERALACVLEKKKYVLYGICSAACHPLAAVVSGFIGAHLPQTLRKLRLF